MIDLFADEPAPDQSDQQTDKDHPLAAVVVDRFATDTESSIEDPAPTVRAETHGHPSGIRTPHQMWRPSEEVPAAISDLSPVAVDAPIFVETAVTLADFVDHGQPLLDIYDEQDLREMKIDEKFPKVDESIPTDYRCPSCAYEWSGNPKPSIAADANVAEIEDV